MKYFIIGLLSFASVSAFAANIEQTIARIEFEENAKCIRTGQTRFQFCTGGASPYNSCIYSVKFECVSNSGNFGLKLKVRESYNNRTQKREAKVRKVVFKR